MICYLLYVEMTLAYPDLSDNRDDGSSLAVTLEARTKDSGVVAVISFLGPIFSAAMDE